MKKAKLLLLGGIVSLLSISTFASAKTVSVNCPTDYESESFCNPSPVVKLSEPYTGLCFNFDTSGYGDIRLYGCLGDDCIMSDRTSGPYCFESPVDSVYFTNGGATYNMSFKVKYSIPFVMNGVKTFDPVVEGLNTSITEFIPYLVYISIAILSAIIGFVAIKWLINRIRRNSLSVFSRKNKK